MLDCRDHVFTTIDFAHLQVLDGNAFAAGKTFGSFGRFSIRPESAVRRRTLDQFLTVRLLLLQAFHIHNQSAGRPHDHHRTMVEIQLFE